MASLPIGRDKDRVEIYSQFVQMGPFKIEYENAYRFEIHEIQQKGKEIQEIRVWYGRAMNLPLAGIGYRLKTDQVEKFVNGLVQRTKASFSLRLESIWPTFIGDPKAVFQQGQIRWRFSDGTAAKRFKEYYVSHFFKGYDVSYLAAQPRTVYMLSQDEKERKKSIHERMLKAFEKLDARCQGEVRALLIKNNDPDFFLPPLSLAARYKINYLRLNTLNYIISTKRILACGQFVIAPLSPFIRAREWRENKQCQVDQFCKQYPFAKKHLAPIDAYFTSLAERQQPTCADLEAFRNLVCSISLEEIPEDQREVMKEFLEELAEEEEGPPLSFSEEKGEKAIS